MLSTEELQHTHCLLNTLSSSSLTTNTHATTYRPFEPLPHTSYFINRTTPDSILSELIRTATTTSEFTLDTESDQVYKQTNRPTLIQLQLLLPNDFSIALIVEMCHLPRDDHPKFPLIQELFRRTFSSDKLVYIWGTNNELSPFVIFNLFTIEQINTFHEINLQKEFKLFWTQHHPHSSSSSCICENCIGKLSSEPWSLQDSIVYALHEYLSKTLRNNTFSIGLDPQLFHHTVIEQRHRSELAAYALSDCLSMQRLIIHMKNQHYLFPSFVCTSLAADILELHPTSPLDASLSSPRASPTPADSIPVPASTGLPTTTDSIVSSPPRERSDLSAAARRVIHNRSCTLKQRARRNTVTIIKRNIDRRFRIHHIKFILSALDIPYSAVLAPISRITHKRSLYIGFTADTCLRTYERRIRNLFTPKHYSQFRTNNFLHFRPRHSSSR
ncbi:unnamed protein product [Adineta ricciae]|uniref:Uncharacterized protein n=1 Tax=Adineta ricciae TaxID=249248 RepID=A0A815A379_ADIRI|nr:unnamed protein product [Adineta ricciae]CAF1662662.1 unnamed protein product [Adineta ricciae]